jgi:MFS transporter, DHA2 family, multidrug resistance protein
MTGREVELVTAVDASSAGRLDWIGLAVLALANVLYVMDLTVLKLAVPAEAAAVARDTLGGAVAVVGELPGQLGAAVLQTAREAFVHGMQLSSVIAAVVTLGLAILAMVMLRDRAAVSPEVHADAGAAKATATPCGQLGAATR